MSERADHNVDTRSDWSPGKVNYQAYCTCGWESSWYDERSEAFSAGTGHLVNPEEES